MMLSMICLIGGSGLNEFVFALRFCRWIFQVFCLTFRSYVFGLFIFEIRWRLFPYVFPGCRQMAGKVKIHYGQVVWGGLYVLGKEGVDLGSQEQYYGEVVEENEEDQRESCSACVVA